jgi:hypothetical protein
MVELELPSFEKNPGLVAAPHSPMPGVSSTRVISGSSWKDASEHLKGNPICSIDHIFCKGIQEFNFFLD